MSETQGVPIPDIKHLDQKDLMEKLAASTRDRQDERVKYERMIAALEQRGKSDLDKLRSATALHTQDLEAQNKALLKAISRLQQEVDRLEKENTALRVQAGIHATPQTSQPAPLVMVPGQNVPVQADDKRGKAGHFPVGNIGSPPPQGHAT